MITTFLVLLGLLIIVSVVMVIIGSDGYEWYRGATWVAGAFGLFVALVVSIIGLSMTYQWYAAGAKADILNREYNVQYSQAEIFYASDVVNVVRELDRNRIEINGDFRRERDTERNLPVRNPDNR